MFWSLRLALRAFQVDTGLSSLLGPSARLHAWGLADPAFVSAPSEQSAFGSDVQILEPDEDAVAAELLSLSKLTSPGVSRPPD